MFSFPQKFCVVYLVIKRRHKTSILFIFKLLKVKLLANKGNLLLKLKPVRNVVLSFLKKLSFHNFSSSSSSSSSSMYILLNKYFCYNIFKKLTFILTGCHEYLYISVCI